MKQDLQNLREEIKQLGREIRGQLKGELLTYLGEFVAQRGQVIYPGHTAV